MARPDFYDAPECETHERGAPKFCKKSEPGEGAERSCACITSTGATEMLHRCSWSMAIVTTVTTGIGWRIGLPTN